MTANQLIIEAYDEMYGIAEHNDSVSPLSLVQMHNAENVTIFSSLEKACRRFIRSKMREPTGLSLVEFMELPREVCNTLYSAVEEVAAQDNIKNEELLEELKKLKSQGK